MVRKITRNQVAEAIELGKSFMPKLTAEELAKILNVPLVDMLRLLSLNAECVQFAEDRSIVGLGNANRAARATARELWAAFVEEVGDERRCLNAQNMGEISQAVRGKIKQVELFEHVVAACFAEDQSGNQAREHATAHYGAAVAALMKRIADVRGDGINADKYVFGVPLTPENRKAVEAAGFHVFVATEVAQRLADKVGWKDYEIEEKGAPTLVVHGPAVLGAGTTLGDTKTLPSLPAAPKEDPKPEDPWTPELLAERDEQVKRCMDAGMPQAKVDEVLDRHAKLKSAPKVVIVALKSALNYHTRAIKPGVSAIKESIKDKVREETGREPETAAVPPPAPAQPTFVAAPRHHVVSAPVAPATPAPAEAPTDPGSLLSQLLGEPPKTL